METGTGVGIAEGVVAEEVEKGFVDGEDFVAERGGVCHCGCRGWKGR